MRSVLAGLRRLVIPWGARTGPRIVLDTGAGAPLGQSAAQMFFFDTNLAYMLSVENSGGVFGQMSLSAVRTNPPFFLAQVIGARYEFATDDVFANFGVNCIETQLSATDLAYIQTNNGTAKVEVTDTDVTITGLVTGVAGGYVSDGVRTAAVGGITTTETVVQSLTFTANPAVRYKFTTEQSYQSTVANDLVQARIRIEAGPTLTTAGTQLRSQLPNCDVAGRGQTLPMTATVTGLTGQYTVGVTMVRNSGTGTVSSFGAAAQENTILIEAI